MLNYAILSLPRVAGTKYQQILLQGIRRNIGGYVPYYGEFLMSHSVNELNLELERARWPVVVKLFTHHLSLIDLESIHWEKFDCIYFLYRKNVVDQLISTYVASATGQWNNVKDEPWTPISSITITDEQINDFIHSLTQHDVVENYIRQKLPTNKIVKLEFEEVCRMDLRVKDKMFPTGYDYRTICQNYEYVINRVNKEYT